MSLTSAAMVPPHLRQRYGTGLVFLSDLTDRAGRREPVVLQHRRLATPAAVTRIASKKACPEGQVQANGDATNNAHNIVASRRLTLSVLESARCQ